MHLTLKKLQNIHKYAFENHIYAMKNRKIQ
jgi:hypothetical protein